MTLMIIYNHYQENFSRIWILLPYRYTKDNQSFN